MHTPDVYMIAGPNGAGKTSAAMTLLPDFLRIEQFVNADEIARGLSPLAPESVALQAGKIMIRRVNQLIEERQSFAFETTASGNIHVRTLQHCKKQGYRIHVIFLYLSSVELAISRVKGRVLQGGHNVPQKEIIRRYHNGLDRLKKYYFALADSIEIYDNSLGSISLISERTQPNDWIIYNHFLWEEIYEKTTTT